MPDNIVHTSESWQMWLHRSLGEIVSTLDDHTPEEVAVALEDIAEQLRSEVPRDTLDVRMREYHLRRRETIKQILKDAREARGE